MPGYHHNYKAWEYLTLSHKKYKNEKAYYPFCSNGDNPDKC